MSQLESLRVGVIPYGNCVDSSLSPNSQRAIFDQIDHGLDDPRQISIAQQACLSCVQLVNCKTQSTAIGETLGRRGAGMVVSGGLLQRLTVQQGAAPNEVLQHSFDLKKMPREPVAAIDIIRQAWRAGNLSLDGKRPKGASVCASTFLERLSDSAPMLYFQLDRELGPEAHSSATNIITALLQQHDYAAFSAGIGTDTARSTKRYDQSSYRIRNDDPIVAEYVTQTLAIQKLGLDYPSRRAIHFGPEFYKYLIERFPPDEIGRNTFNTILNHNRRNPEPAFDKYQARLYRERHRGDSLPRSVASRNALLDRQTSDFSRTVDTLYSSYAGQEHVTIAAVRNAFITNPANPEVALTAYLNRVETGFLLYGSEHKNIRPEDIRSFAQHIPDAVTYLAALEKFDKNITNMTRDHGSKDDFTPGIIRRLSRAHLETASQAAIDYEKRLSRLKQESDNSLTNATLRHIAAQSKREISFTEAKQKHLVRQLAERFSYRVKADAELQTIGRPILHRITTLYHDAEMESVAENVFQLVNSGLLVESIGELPSLRDQTWENDLNKVFDPSSRKYLTFNAALQALDTTDRLALAQHYNLMPLIYGLEGNTSAFESILGDDQLATYCDDTLLPRCQELTGVSKDTNSNPLQSSQLSADIRYFIHALDQPEGAPHANSEATIAIHGIHGTLLVVGGRILKFYDTHSMATDWDTAKPEVTDWVIQVVSKAYSSTQDRDTALARTKDALENGVIQLAGTGPEDFRFTFSDSFYAATITDLDRAIVSHELRLDRLLYGTDLSEILEARLPALVHDIIIARSESVRPVDVTATVLGIKNIRSVTVGRTRETPTKTKKTLFEAEPELHTILTGILEDSNLSKPYPELRFSQLKDAMAMSFRSGLLHTTLSEDQNSYAAIAWQFIYGASHRTLAADYECSIQDIPTYIERGVAVIQSVLSHPDVRLYALKRLIG